MAFVLGATPCPWLSGSAASRCNLKGADSSDGMHVACVIVCTQHCL